MDLSDFAAFKQAFVGLAIPEVQDALTSLEAHQTARGTHITERCVACQSLGRRIVGSAKDAIRITGGADWKEQNPELAADAEAVGAAIDRASRP